MWIVKGALLGILLFIASGLSYVGIRIAIALHRAQPTLNVLAGGGGTQYDVRIWLGPLRGSVILAVLLAAIAIGLWIMRARATRTV